LLHAPQLLLSGDPAGGLNTYKAKRARHDPPIRTTRPGWPAGRRRRRAERADADRLDDAQRRLTPVKTRSPCAPPSRCRSPRSV